MSNDLLVLVRTSLIDELERLHNAVRELTQPLSEQALWIRPLERSNSIGHLILHLTGNLNHFVGGRLGGTGYVRDREREFTEANPPSKAVLLDNLDAAITTFRRVVEQLTAAQLAAPHPETRFGLVLPALIQLLSHFAVHRGQMSYIVRLINIQKT